MSLSNLASLGSFVSGLAVLVSLGFLYFQLRQMTQQVREAAKSSRDARAAALATDILNFRRQIVESADVARIYRDGLADFDTLDSTDKWRFGALMQQLLQEFELIRRYDDVIFHDRVYSGAWIFARPGAQKWWQSARHMYDAATRARVDADIERGIAMRRDRAARQDVA